MKLIVGGAGNGKLAYVLESTGFSEAEVARDFESAGAMPIFYGSSAIKRPWAGRGPDLLMERAGAKTRASSSSATRWARAWFLLCRGRRYGSRWQICCRGSLADEWRRYLRHTHGQRVTAMVISLIAGATPQSGPALCGFHRRAAGRYRKGTGAGGRKVSAGSACLQEPMLRFEQTAGLIFPKTDKWWLSA